MKFTAIQMSRRGDDVYADLCKCNSPQSSKFIRAREELKKKKKKYTVNRVKNYNNKKSPIICIFINFETLARE